MKKLTNFIITTQLVTCLIISGNVLAESRQTDKATVHGNFAASQFKLDMILARRGDADAQYYVGTAYEQANGTRKDMKQAFHWYSKAAQQGQPEAEYKVGYFYEHGLIVKRDMNTAMRWYKRAIESSHGTLRARLRQEAFPQQTSSHAPERTAEKAKQIKQARQEKERQQQHLRALARERERLHKLAQARARKETAYKKQLALAQRQRLNAASKARTKPDEHVHIPDLADVILNNQWSYGSESADYLPSKSTHCLRSSASEIVCFSNEKQRVVNNHLVSYTTKSSLTGFKPNGTFQVRYYFNVTKMTSDPNQGVSVDPSGLRLKKGWQEPRLVMNCRTVDRVNLYCTRGSYRLQFHN